MTIVESDIRQAVKDGVITADAYASIVKISGVRAESTDGHFDVIHVLWLVGLVCFTFATVTLIHSFDRDDDNFAGMVFSGLLLLASLVASGKFRKNKLNFLSACACVLTGLYTLAFTFTAWSCIPHGSEDDFFFLLGLTATVVGVIESVRRQYPASILILWVGISCLVYCSLGFPSGERRDQFLLHLGWITLLESYVFNIIDQRRNYTFWLNKAGLLALATGLTALYVDESAKPTIVQLPVLYWALGLLVAAGILKYASYLVTGVTTLVTYLGFFVYAMFPNNVRLVAVVLALMAMLLLAVGVWIFKRKATLDRWTPRRLTRLIPPPLPSPLFGDIISDKVDSAGGLR